VKSGAPSSADILSRVLDRVQREPALPRPKELRRRALLIASGFSLAALVVLARRALDRSAASRAASNSAQPLWHVVAARDALIPHRPLGYVLAVGLAWLLVAIAATWVGVTRGRSMLGRSARSKLAVTLLTPVVLALTWFVIALTWLRSMDSAPPVRLDAYCALTSLACAAGPLAALFALRGNSDLSPRQAGGALAAVAGAWGALIYFGFCECTSAIHIASAHLLPVAVLAAFGVLVGERVLGIRTAKH
jgi:Negative regulator of sigma F